MPAPRAQPAPRPLATAAALPPPPHRCVCFCPPCPTLPLAGQAQGDGPHAGAGDGGGARGAHGRPVAPAGGADRGVPPGAGVEPDCAGGGGGGGGHLGLRHQLSGPDQSWPACRTPAPALLQSPRPHLASCSAPPIHTCIQALPIPTLLPVLLVPNPPHMPPSGLVPICLASCWLELRPPIQFMTFPSLLREPRCETCYPGTQEPPQHVINLCQRGKRAGRRPHAAQRCCARRAGRRHRGRGHPQKTGDASAAAGTQTKARPPHPSLPCTGLPPGSPLSLSLSPSLSQLLRSAPPPPKSCCTATVPQNENRTVEAESIDGGRYQEGRSVGRVSQGGQGKGWMKSRRSPKSET